MTFDQLDFANEICPHYQGNSRTVGYFFGGSNGQILSLCDFSNDSEWRCDLHCRSDQYLIDEFLIEYNE